VAETYSRLRCLLYNKVTYDTHIQYAFVGCISHTETNSPFLLIHRGPLKQVTTPTASRSHSLLTQWIRQRYNNTSKRGNILFYIFIIGTNVGRSDHVLFWDIFPALAWWRKAKLTWTKTNELAVRIRIQDLQNMNYRYQTAAPCHNTFSIPSVNIRHHYSPNNRDSSPHYLCIRVRAHTSQPPEQEQFCVTMVTCRRPCSDINHELIIQRLVSLTRRALYFLYTPVLTMSLLGGRTPRQILLLAY
jgi:hypothetical protein